MVGSNKIYKSNLNGIVDKCGFVCIFDEVWFLNINEKSKNLSFLKLWIQSLDMYKNAM